MTYDALINKAKTFAARTGKSLSTVSLLAANNGKFLDGIISGKGCTVDRYNRVMSYLEENMPQDSHSLNEENGKGAGK